MPNFSIEMPNKSLEKDIQFNIDHKTKPLGSLGRLEEITLQIALIQQTQSPKLVSPHLVVFAADHGIAGAGVNAGVSAFPQEVTYQMVLNFLNGGAAINVFAKQNNINLIVVDAGVNYDFAKHESLINAKIAKQTANYLTNKAITSEQLEHCLTQGAQIVANIHAKGCNVIGFGEMGIANTSSAAILMSICCKSLIENCVGRGTGLSDEQLENKIQVLRKAILHHNLDNETATLEEILMAFGGFEIAMMCGAMLKAAELKMVVLVDGFIATAAFLVAHHKEPLVKEYAIFTHQSDEQGHKKMLDFLKVKPILNLNMRLGEGTGCAMAYPIINAAANFLTEMASFGSAGVSEK